MTLLDDAISINLPSSSSKETSWVSPYNQPLFNKVEQRVLAQLVQTLLYENIIPIEISQKDGQYYFVVQGQNTLQQRVAYYYPGTQKKSFEQIKINRYGALRLDQSGQETTATLALFIDEVLKFLPDTLNLSNFINELEQTLLKDAQSLQQFIPESLADVKHSFDELEHHIMDAHSYHACYKSRIGFTLKDNQKYGPEFGQDIPLVWLAVCNSLASVSASVDNDYEGFIKQQLTPTDSQLFSKVLASHNKQLKDVKLIPVHPWQWQEKIIASFYPELLKGDIIHLGSGQENYRAQQSIRTLCNVVDKQKPYAKTALNITNTSSTRILANHTIMNGPIITDWLQQLINNSPIAQKLDFVVLREFLGVSFDYQSLPEHRNKNTYGSLGVIWRENISKYLRPNESAVPLNGLTHKQKNGMPLIDDWINEYGLEKWTKELIEVSVLPIIHMLYAEGIGMESHGQNIVLFHNNGWPTRIALKDFHDGVRYSEDDLAQPELKPKLHDIPASHAKINRNSFILTSDLDAVRDFTCDAFFFICLAEIAIFINSEYGLNEDTFWEMTASSIINYQQQHPEHSKRFSQFDVFSSTYQVEELTKRRLFGDSEPRFKDVPNPLYKFRASAC